MTGFMRAAAIVGGLTIGLPVLGMAQRDPALARELEAATGAMERAFARGDMRAIARTYADDAQMIPPSGKPITGRAALDDFWRKIRHPRSWDMETLDWGGTRDEAWQLVRSTMLEGPSSDNRPHIVRCLLVWRRQPDGSLRIHLDIWTEGERAWASY